MQVITNSHEKTTLEEARGGARGAKRGGREAVLAGFALIFAYVFRQGKIKINSFWQPNTHKMINKRPLSVACHAHTCTCLCVRVCVRGCRVPLNIDVCLTFKAPIKANASANN